MKETILSIEGKPGLFRLVAQGANNLIVEALDDTKKRFATSIRDRVTPLNDVSIYSDDNATPLMQVFENIKIKQQGGQIDIQPRGATNEELATFMAEILPAYDRSRVHASDIKKLIRWYNILTAVGYTDFVVAEDEQEAAQES